MTDAAIRASTPSTSAIFKLAWPITFKAMMLHGIVVIDAYLVSSLGESAVAAMGLAASIGGLLLGIVFAFSNATQIRIAQAFGTATPVALKTGFLCGLFVNLVSAGLGILLVALFGGKVIDAFAHTEWIADQAKLYLNAFMFVVIAEAFGQCLGSHFNGCGKTKMPFYSYLLALPVNICTSIVLIHGLYGFPELGVLGAAVGSAIAAIVRLIFLGTRMYRWNGFFRGVEGWKNGSFAASVQRHLKFSLPIAATFISMFIANNVCTLIFAKMSVNQFAAMTLIQPWIMVAGTFSLSWSQATGIMMAQLLGRQTPSDALDEFLSRAWRMAFVAAAIVSTLYMGVILMSETLYSELQQETRSALFSFWPILLLLPFPKGSNAICGNTLRAGGETVFVMNLFVGAQWLFRVPMTAFLVLWVNAPVFWVFAIFLGEELVKFPFFHKRLYEGAWKKGVQEDD